MPDEFPTLEVVALIGVIVALVRTFQLRVALGEIPKLGRELERSLRAGDLAGARALCQRTEGAAFARVGSALVERLAGGPVAKNELRRVARDAKKRAALGIQRKRGRDLVVAAVLIGAGAYALRANLGVGTAFYALLVVALLVTALGPVLRRATLVALEAEGDRLLDAALAFRGSSAAAVSPCPECGASEAVDLSGKSLAGLSALGIETLRVCRQCGAVRGRAKSPETIALDEANGVSAAHSLPDLGSSADPESEHQG
ncbi:MAG TPA: hypothetical protein VGK73_40060 [Polyangiaceae bacterium]